MTRLLIAFVVFQIGALLGSAQVIIPDLDTRVLPRPLRVEKQPEGPVVESGPTMARLDKPVTIRLMRVEPSSCTWDESLTYDVEIGNASSDVLTIPWTLTPPTVALPTLPKTVFPLAMLSLKLGARGLDGDLGGIETLYGHPSDVRSARELPPKSAVTIRVGTTCRPRNSSVNRILASGGSATVPVSATVWLTRNQSEGGVFVTSNEVMVTVTKPAPTR